MTGQSVTWAQLNLAAAEDLRGLMRRQRLAAEMVILLIERMQPGGGGVIVIGRQALSELLSTSMSSVERALRLLISEGWVQRIKVGGAQALAINSRVAWIGPRGDLPFAVFTATVIASRSEQDQASLAPPPIRQVPMVLPGEIPLTVGEGLEPPSQPELPDMSPIVAVKGGADQVDRELLEQRGQLRIDEALP